MRLPCVCRRLVSSLSIAAVLFVQGASADRLQVDASFMGGSAEVVSIDQEARLIVVNPAKHEGHGWVCWWYFKINGITPGETIQVDIGEAPWATPDQAAISFDNKTWTQTERGKRTGKRIRYSIKVDAESMWLAWGPPFTPEDAGGLVETTAKNHAFATSFELCRTRGDRPTPALRIAEGDAKNRYGIWIQARQHAWESGSSWVCRGLVDWLVSDDPRAASLREQSLIYIVPIVDIDNTAIGAGGKNQQPHDHNRDWGEKPHWRATAASQRYIEEMDRRGKFDFFIDLHNPGANSKFPFYYVPPKDLLGDMGQRNLDRFLAASREDMTGPLTFRGQVQTSGANYDKRWKFISKNWVAAHTHEHVVAVTLETAWNTPSSTTSGYQSVGRQLGMAIERYFRTEPRESD